jgi:hypothetical protein
MVGRAGDRRPVRGIKLLHPGRGQRKDARQFTLKQSGSSSPTALPGAPRYEPEA